MARPPGHPADAEIDARLDNWAAVMCGAVGPQRLIAPPAPTRRGFMLADAELLEAALVELRRRRPDFYSALMARYRERLMDQSAAAGGWSSVDAYRRAVYGGYHWLDGCLMREHTT